MWTYTLFLPLLSFFVLCSADATAVSRNKTEGQRRRMSEAAVSLGADQTRPGSEEGAN